MGFPSATSAKSNAFFGAGSGPIFLDNVACTGYESSVTECSHGGLGNHNCGHNEDAGVVCTTTREFCALAFLYTSHNTVFYLFVPVGHRGKKLREGDRTSSGISN